MPIDRDIPYATFIVESGARTSATQVGINARETVYGTATGDTVGGDNFYISTPSTDGIKAYDGEEVADGGISSDATILADGYLWIDAGGNAIGATACSSSYIEIAAQGVDSGATVSDGSREVVNGLSYNATIDAGAFQDLEDSGSAISATINATGVQYLHSGTTAIGTTVNSGGQVYLSGGLISSATINSDGLLIVSSGSIASDTQILTGGTEIVSAGALESGGTATSATLTLNGGSATGITLSAGGNAQVSSGGTLTDATLSHGGTATISSGGLLSGGIISSGGLADISSGGTASAITVSSGGTTIIEAGATTGGDIISASGSETVLGTASTTTLSAGTQTIGNGGSAISATVDQNGTQSVNNGGTALDTTVSSGGTLTVSSGGIANSTIISSGGSETILNGTSDDTTLLGGLLSLQGAEATATLTEIGSDSEIDLSDSATLSSITLSNGALSAWNDGTASNVTLSSAASATLSSGGSVSTATVSSGGLLTILSSGAASAVIISASGTADVSSGGQISDATVSSGGTLTIEAGGTARGGTISDSGSETILGTGITLTVQAGGTLTASAGAQVSGATVSNSGLETIDGGTSEDTTIHGGILEASTGAVVTSVLIDSAGTATVSNALLASGTVNDGTLNAEAGGTVTDTTLGSDGTATISSGGSFNDGSAISGGTLSILSGGTASDVTLASNGNARISAGGTLSNATLTDGGLATISSGGLVTNAILSSGGSAEIVSGGQLNTATVSSGGDITIEAGGIASDITLSAGGTETVIDGTSDDTTITGGLLSLQGADTTATITDVNAAGEVDISDSATVTSLTLNDGTLSAWNGGTASNVTLSSAASAVISSGGTLTTATLSSGGSMTVETSASATGITVSDSGTLTVSSGGTASGITISSGGIAQVSGEVTAGYSLLRIATLMAVATTSSAVDSGSTISNVTISSGGELLVSTSGTATGVTIESAGSEIVDGGSSFDITLHGGQLTVEQPAASASTITVDSSGSVIVTDSATVNGISLSNGTVSVTSSAELISVTLGSLGSATALSGGSITSATILSGGELDLGPGGTATDVTISSGGITELSSGGTLAGTTILSGGTLSILAGGTASGTDLTNGGAIDVSDGGTFSNGTLLADSLLDILASGNASGLTLFSGAVATVENSGSLTSGTILSGGGLDVLSGGTASDIALSSGGTLDVQSGATLTALDFLSGGTLVLDDEAWNSDATVSWDSATSTLTADENGNSYTFDLTGDYENETFAILENDQDLAQIEIGTPCFCRGTLILTTSGERLVESLAIGNHVITASGHPRPIVWIGRRTFSGTFAADNLSVQPVLFRKHSLGNGLPKRDLWVSPLHAMYLEGKLVPANALVNGRTIIQARHFDLVDYFHIELETHNIILSEGAASETFVNDGSRLMFRNAAEFAELYPDYIEKPALYCAPRIEDGFELELIRRNLSGHASLNDKTPSGTTGYLREATGGHLLGWVRAADKNDESVAITILDNNIPLKIIKAEKKLPVSDTRPDRIFSFDTHIGALLDPDRPHLIELRRTADNAPLAGSSVYVAPAEQDAAVQAHQEGPVTREHPPQKPVQGYLDNATRRTATGWAWNGPEQTDPVILDVFCNDIRICSVVANRYRGDLVSHAIGDGRHGFHVVFPCELSPAERRIIRVRRAADGTELYGSPFTIEAENSFSTDLQDVITRATRAAAGSDERARIIHFLRNQADSLATTEATDRSGRFETEQAASEARRTGTVPLSGEKRALVITADLSVCRPGSPSGGLRQHMILISQAGYKVTVIPAGSHAVVPTVQTDLEALGITVCGIPFVSSVEDMLRQYHDVFDSVIVDSPDLTRRYQALIRDEMPRARLIMIEGKNIAPPGQKTKNNALPATLFADAILSCHPQETLRLHHQMSGANVFTLPVPGNLTPQTALSFEEMSGFFLISSTNKERRCACEDYFHSALLPPLRTLCPDPDITHDPDRCLSARVGLVLPGSDSGITAQIMDMAEAGIPIVFAGFTKDETARLPLPLHALIARTPRATAEILATLYTNPAFHRLMSRAMQNWATRIRDKAQTTWFAVLTDPKPATTRRRA